MKKIFYSFCFLAFLMGATPAQARLEDGTVLPASTILPLMQWIQGQTGIQVPFLPKVIVSHSEFRTLLARLDGQYVGRPRSVYMSGRVILDSATWDPEDPVQVSLLVHELVHHAQVFIKQANWKCPDARERMAYTLQNKWLEERGHVGFARASWIDRMASCGEDEDQTTVALAQAGR